MGSEASPATSHTALQHHARRQLNAECMRNVQHTKTYMHCSFISKVKVIDLCATRQILKIYREVFSTQALLHLPGASCAGLTGSQGRRRRNSNGRNSRLVRSLGTRRIVRQSSTASGVDGICKTSSVQVILKVTRAMTNFLVKPIYSVH